MPRRKRIRHHPIVLTFGKRLRDIRKQRGVSQQALAIKAGASTSYIGKLERGEIACGLDMVGRMAEALGTDPKVFIEVAPDARSAQKELRAHARDLVEKVLRQNDDAAVEALAVVAGLMYSALARSPGAKPAR